METKIKQTCKDFLAKKDNRIFLLLYFGMPVLINLIIESLARKSPWGGFVFLAQKPYTFWCDVLIIIFTLSITFLARRRIFWVSFFSIIWLIFGISNYVLLCNRVTPFTAEDLKSISDANGVLNKYFNHQQITITIIIFIVVIIAMGFLFYFAPKLEKRDSILKSLGMIFIVYVLMMVSIFMGINFGALEAKFGELSKSYLKNGFVYCFSNSLINTGIKKPSNYSEQTIAKITGKEDDEPEATVLPQPQEEEKDVLTPNIIIVQLESFFDINNVKDVEFSKNPLPNFTELMDEWASGYFGVPIVGAGTVNSEFEVMTGMNLNDFGPGEYPFKTIMKTTTCESMAYNLKEHGYTAQFVHNNTGRFYGRNIVYSNLGFDTFTSVEYMQVENRTPMGWAKDYYLRDQIMDCLENTENQDLIYAISVQGHGSYPADIDYDHHLRIKSINEKYEDMRGSLEYYANQLYEMDAFIGKLVDTLSNYDEDTILVMYGDHLPSFNFEDEDLKNESIYQTSYFIWNNMGLDFESQDLEAYELNSVILEKLGIKDGVINEYHQNNRGTTDEEEYLNGLQNLEYDILYGDMIVYDGKNPYKATDMQLGIKPITIDTVYLDQYLDDVEDTDVDDDDLQIEEEEETEDEPEDVYVVKGQNFTAYSKVYVNEEKVKTEFVDSSTLYISDCELKSGDTIAVWQSALSCTEDYLFSGEEEKPQTDASEDEPEVVKKKNKSNR